MLDRATVERALATSGPIIVALSGGGDSTSLLHLLAEAVGAARLRAAVVDHGLRDGSDGDARRALSFASALGVDGAVLTLRGVKRAQAAARAARYAALCGYTRANGASVIAVAHTRDDQAETVFMRATAGSGWRGLAGMAALAPAPIWPEGRGLMLMRPLLGARRTALRDDLRARGAAWIEDPANANAAFERVRARQRLAEWAAEGVDVMRLAALADRFAAHARRIDAEAARLMRGAVRFEAETVLMARAAWDAPAAVRQRLLSVLILAAGAGAREPGAAQVEGLDAQLAADAFKSATLGGAVLRRGGGQIVISRDRGALMGRADGSAPLPDLPLPVGVETIWDGRAALTITAPGWSVVAATGAPELVYGEQRLPLEAAKPTWLIAQRALRELEADG